MQFSEIPFEPSLADYEFNTTIVETQYQFRVRWNSSDDNKQGAWYFDIFEVDGTIIATGLKVAMGARIGFHIQHHLFYEGIIFAYDTSAKVTGRGRPPGFDDMGTRVKLLFMPMADLALLNEIAAHSKLFL